MNLPHWGHLGVTCVTLAKSHRHAIFCLKVETSQAEGGLVTETSLGLLLHISIFFFLSAERAGLTSPPCQELFTNKKIVSVLVNEAG